MTDEDRTAIVRKILFSAPDFEGESIEPTETFRDRFEIDSMDFLNFITALSKAIGRDIPDTDCPELETLAKEPLNSGVADAVSDGRGRFPGGYRRKELRVRPPWASFSLTQTQVDRGRGRD